MPARSGTRKGKVEASAARPPQEAPKRGACTPTKSRTKKKALASSPPAAPIKTKSSKTKGVEKPQSVSAIAKGKAKAAAVVVGGFGRPGPAATRHKAHVGKAVSVSVEGPGPRMRVDVRLRPGKGSLRASGVAIMSGTRSDQSASARAAVTIRTSAPDGVGRSLAKRGDVASQSAYRPNEAEPFMNERQRTYFRNKLLAWKEDILRQNQETLHGLFEDTSQYPDLTDRATSETDRALELRARDRQRKLMAKIDAALARIEEGTYGYCEETGEPISLKRLDARPIATMSLEAQERKERMERVFRED